MGVIRNIDKIFIADLKIRFFPPDMTLVHSEMVVFTDLGYSRTQHAKCYFQGVVSVSGHCHLGIIRGIRGVLIEIFQYSFKHSLICSHGS